MAEAASVASGFAHEARRAALPAGGDGAAGDEAEAAAGDAAAGEPLLAGFDHDGVEGLATAAAGATLALGWRTGLGAGSSAAAPPLPPPAPQEWPRNDSTQREATNAKSIFGFTCTTIYRHSSA